MATKTADVICLIRYREEMGIEEVIEELYTQQKQVLEKIGAPPGKKIGDVLVAYRDCGGAVYSPRTIDTNYYFRARTAIGPSRVSVVYHPMYMQERALESYVKLCNQENHLPVVLADITTVTERKIAMDTYTVEKKFPGMRQVTEELAKDENLTYVEFKIDDLIKTKAD